MQFINPIGRTAEGGIQPRACKCHTGFATARGTNDTCLRCGCSCDAQATYTVGNMRGARFTIRAS